MVHLLSIWRVRLLTISTTILLVACNHDISARIDHRLAFGSMTSNISSLEMKFEPVPQNKSGGKTATVLSRIKVDKQRNQDLNDEWVKIPAGPYIYGKDDQKISITFCNIISNFSKKTTNWSFPKEIQ